MASFATSFTIKEITGQQRTLTLTGRALPRRPMEFSGTMRADVTWYPGNPEATVQMLGAGEDPTTITGKWSTRFIQGSQYARIGGAALQSAEEIADKVDDMRRKGALIEVAWFSRIRRGYISKFVQNWLYPTDVEWSLEFTWISQGEATVPAVVNAGANVSSIRKQIKTQSTKATAVAAKAKATFPATRALLSAIQDGAAALSVVSDQVNATVNKVAKAILPIEDATRRAASQMDTLIASVANPLGALASVVPREFVDAVDIARVTAGQALAAHNAVRQGNRVFRDSTYLGAVQREALIRRIDGQVMMPYVAREGDDLRTVARMVYGSPDDWRQIAAFNGLTSSALSTGQRIFIPRPKSFGGG